MCPFMSVFDVSLYSFCFLLVDIRSCGAKGDIADNDAYNETYPSHSIFIQNLSLSFEKQKQREIDALITALIFEHTFDVGIARIQGWQPIRFVSL